MSEVRPGDQYGHQIQNADVIFNQFGGETEDHFNAGLAALDNGMYPEAVAKFRQCMAGAGATDMSAARGLLVVASLAGRAAYRQSQADIRVLNRQLELDGDNVLSLVLRALINEDRAGDVGSDSDGPGPVEELSVSEIRVLAAHLTPMRGETWRRVVDRARQLGYRAELPLSCSVALAAEPARRPGVAQRCDLDRYFNTDVRIPPFYLRPDWGPPHYRGAGTVVVVLSVVVGQILSGTLGVFGLLIAGALFWYAYQLAHPRPTEAQLDAWLTEDVGRTTAMGMVRLGLRPGHHAQGGELTADPVVVVGIPLDTKQIKVSHMDGSGEKVHREHMVLCARFRAGAEGLVRADRYQIAVLYPTEPGVEGYLATVDPRTGKITDLAGEPLSLVGREPRDEVFEFKAGSDRVSQVRVLRKVDMVDAGAMAITIVMPPGNVRLRLAHNNKEALQEARKLLRWR